VPGLLMQADPALGAALTQEDLEFILKSNPGFEPVHFPGASHGIHIDQPEKTLQVFKAFAQKLG